MQEEIINILNNKDKSYTITEINDLLGLTTIEEYQKLQNTLEDLCSNGIVYYSEKKKKYLLLSNSHLLSGKLILNNKGFGFVEIDKESKDIYVSEENIGTARNGDTVLIELITKDKVRPEGKIIKIIKRDYTPVVGVVFIENDEYYVKPDKKGHDIYIPKEYINGAVEGHKVLVRPLKEGNYVGEIIQIIGHVNDVGVDILSFVYQYGFRPNFPEEVEKELESIPLELNAEMINNGLKEGRIDLRNEVIFTIDGDDTKDIDDAVSIEKLSDGYKLGVHIADVSYYVKEGTALNDEAYYRSTSVYLVDRVVPMLPHKLSNGICSLNPNCDRFAMSCIMKINYKGEVVDYEIHPSIIRSRIQMTYNKVNEILENDTIPTGYEEFAEKLKLMNELSDILRKKMVARGYMEFNAPEAKILVDEKCHPYKIELRSQRTGEKLIENFMIVANETVASHIYYQDLPSIYRVHDKPNQEKIQSFLNFLSLRGYVVTGKNKIVSVKDLQNILKQLKDKPDSIVLNDLAIRSQAKAVYSEENIGHFGLGSKCYAHFTSPIRRYPDLILHRLLKDYATNCTKKTVEKWELSLPSMCEHTSQKELDSVNCERDVEKMKKAEYMEDHIGEIYEGVISGVTPFGIFVELPNTVEGLVKFEDIPGDYFVYDESGYMIYGTKTNKRYMFGDTVKVKVVSTSHEESLVDFIMLNDKNTLKDNRKERYSNKKNKYKENKKIHKNNNKDKKNKKHKRK